MTHIALRPFASWSLTLIGILVALGTQTFLEALVPASIANLEFGHPDKTMIYRAGTGQFWVAETLIRGASFFVGGYVSGRLTVALGPRLFAILVLAAALVTLFQQLPASGPILWWVLWAIEAPTAIALGAYTGQPRRSAA